MPKRNTIINNKSALNVGAFYFEDAAAVLKRAGCVIGSLEFTYPPGRPYEPPDCADSVPARAYRVIRCLERDAPENNVYDILLTRAGEYADERR